MFTSLVGACEIAEPVQQQFLELLGQADARNDGGRYEHTERVVAIVVVGGGPQITGANRYWFQHVASNFSTEKKQRLLGENSRVNFRGTSSSCANLLMNWC